MNEQTYKITEEILSDIEAQGETNYSLLARSLVAEIRRLQAAVHVTVQDTTLEYDEGAGVWVKPATEAPVVASETAIEVGDKVVVVAGEDAGRTGVVVFTPQRSHPVYTVLKGMVYIAYRREEIEKL